MASRRWHPKNTLFNLGVVLSAYGAVQVQVEMDDDTVVTGELYEVRRHNSLVLKNATVTKPMAQQSRKFDTIYVHARYVRYVVLPQGSISDKLDGFARRLLAARLAEARKNRKPFLEWGEGEHAQQRAHAIKSLEPEHMASELHFSDRPRIVSTGAVKTPRPEAAASNVLYVGGLDWLMGEVTAEEIRGLAEPFGKVTSIHIARNRTCAFIHMDSQASASCVRAFYPNGWATLRDKRVHIRFAWPKKPPCRDEAQELLNLAEVADRCFVIAQANKEGMTPKSKEQARPSVIDRREWWMYAPSTLPPHVPTARCNASLHDPFPATSVSHTTAPKSGPVQHMEQGLSAVSHATVTQESSSSHGLQSPTMMQLSVCSAQNGQHSSGDDRHLSSEMAVSMDIDAGTPKSESPSATQQCHAELIAQDPHSNVNVNVVMDTHVDGCPNSANGSTSGVPQHVDERQPARRICPQKLYLLLQMAPCLPNASPSDFAKVKALLDSKDDDGVLGVILQLKTMTVSHLEQLLAITLNKVQSLPSGQRKAVMYAHDTLCGIISQLQTSGLIELVY